mmetsp:Transcript_33466/g.56887  ORF Transcript_33466/g.56887 Transcript_33466/m.56887 type:complete len:218 (-) Transcript_33466:224-877(-)
MRCGCAQVPRAPFPWPFPWPTEGLGGLEGLAWLEALEALGALACLADGRRRCPATGRDRGAHDPSRSRLGRIVVLVGSLRQAEPAAVRGGTWETWTTLASSASTTPGRPSAGRALSACSSASKSESFAQPRSPPRSARGDTATLSRAPSYRPHHTTRWARRRRPCAHWARASSWRGSGRGGPWHATPGPRRGRRRACLRCGRRRGSAICAPRRADGI